MKFLFHWFSGTRIFVLRSLVVAQATILPGAYPAWTVPSAPARFVIGPDENTIAPALISWVNISLPDPNWASLPVQVFTEQGPAVGAEVLWASPGEPVTVAFDSSSGAKYYQVYFGSDSPGLKIPNKEAGVTIEYREGDGKIINTLPEMLQSWSQRTRVLGLAIDKAINEGGNRFGPQTNLLAHYKGWFELGTAEHLQLAVISTDATFVLVDGKEVVEWPGLHDFNLGRDGKHQGAIDLSPGVHSLDYYNAFVQSSGGGKPFLCCLAAKGGFLTDWTLLRKDIPFFRNVVSYNVRSYGLPVDSVPVTWAPIAAPALAINCHSGDQSIIDSDLVDFGLIAMHLQCFARNWGNLDCTWTFDDGSTEKGLAVSHLFPRPGMRSVRVTLKNGETLVATLTETINVHPDWLNVWKQPELRPEQEANILARDLSALSVSDLAGCFAVFEHYRRTQDLLIMLPLVSAKIDQFNESDLSYIKKGAVLLAHEDWAHAAEEIQFLRTLINRPVQPGPTPPVASIASESRLALAQLLLSQSTNTDEVRSLIDAIDVSSLSRDETRELSILRADLAIANGNVSEARKEYEALTVAPSGLDARSSIRLTAEIGQARAFINQKDFDGAEDSLNDVASHEPIEKMSPEWALTRLRLYQAENRSSEAYIWARRLMPVLESEGRSELLFRLTEIAFSQKDEVVANKTLSELLNNHPYSQEAAQAKQIWPRQQ
jgi:TolA-binding protein